MSANFDKLNQDFVALQLQVRNTSDEILELVGQIKNGSDDQAQVDAAATQLEQITQNLKDSTDAAVAQNPAPAPAPVVATPDPSTPPAA